MDSANNKISENLVNQWLKGFLTLTEK